MQAQFIVIEGVEGAGKTTAIKHIEAYLSKMNISYILTREPGGTQMSENIRDILKTDYADETVYGETEVLLLYAARLQLVNNVIKPALANGTWVIGDRHDLSTIAYQSGGRGVDIELINNIKHAVLGDFTYDYCLYLDIDPALGMKRAISRGKLDRIEQEEITFFNKIRQKYLDLAANDDRVKTINASQAEDDVARDILEELSNRYG